MMLLPEKRRKWKLKYKLNIIDGVFAEHSVFFRFLF